LYLETKGVDDLNGTEFEVWTTYSNTGITFFPVGNTTYLEERSDKNEEIEEIKSSINSVVKSIETLSGEVKGLKTEISKLTAEKTA
jgi:hypothetical protein